MNAPYAEGLVVGFDLDMTLLDTRPGIAAAFRALSAETGVHVDTDAVTSRLGPPLEEELALWYPAERVTEVVARYRELYPVHAIEPSGLLPGAAEAVAAVRAQHGRVVVITAKHPRLASLHLDQVGLQVDEVVGLAWQDGKATALRERGAAVYVGDHTADVLAGRSAGAAAVAVVTGGIGADQLAAAGADVVLPDLTGFPSWLDDHLREHRLADLMARLAGLAEPPAAGLAAAEPPAAEPPAAEPPAAEPAAAGPAAAELAVGGVATVGPAARGGLMVAFSGGADSAFLLAAAVRALGAGRVVAATAVSDSLPASELRQAAEFAAGLGVRHLTPGTDEMGRDGYRANAGDRCYFCKAELLDTLGPLAAELAVGHVATGTNADDGVAGFRPGIRAAAERGALTPLRDAGLTKAQVRRISADWGLATWDKPAAACLSSRIAYGIQISPARLHRVERAERSLRAELTGAGFPVRNLRVRDLGEKARIEVDAEFVPAVTERSRLLATLDGLDGFAEIEVDPRGFRSGAMNELLVTPERYRH
jgi:uncharacterized protein